MDNSFYWRSHSKPRLFNSSLFIGIDLSRLTQNTIGNRYGFSIAGYGNFDMLLVLTVCLARVKNSDCFASYGDQLKGRKTAACFSPGEHDTQGCKICQPHGTNECLKLLYIFGQKGIFSYRKKFENYWKLFQIIWWELSMGSNDRNSWLTTFGIARTLNWFR